jgi:peptidoglycan hydrolase-like protein with peptidoglycan-binding domain
MRRLAVLLAVMGMGVVAAVGASGASAAGPRVARDAASGTGLTLTATNVNGSVGAIVSGASWVVNGVVAHYTPGQRITLHVFRNGVRVLSRKLAVHRLRHHGVYSASLSLSGIGRLTVRALEPATATQSRIVSPAFSLWLVAAAVYPGERSYAVRILQHQLSALHYVIGARGVYDDRTQRAVLAFRKMAALVRDEVADPSVFAALAAGEGTFTIRYPSQGRHIEADLTHQVLALIGANGLVQRLYPISSGKPSTPTALGNFSVYYKTPGINDKGMVDSSYFNGGDAIHGYAEVPTYAASHGCLRAPIPDALSIYEWATLGTPVDVYYR